MVHWPPSRWVAAALGALAAALVLGIPTDLVDTPVFGRSVPVPTWAWVAWAAGSVLSGLLLATYVQVPEEVAAQDAGRRGGPIGGLLVYLAIGCPTCNKIAVLALGTSGALTWFGPAQPVLALLSLVFLVVALRRRLAAERACPVPRRARAADAVSEPLP